MSARASTDTVSRPAMLLVAGRAVGFAATFVIPVVLSRVLAPAEFGTYKQLFLVFATLYGVAQLGMAESLYYFVPRRSAEAGRYVANAVVTLWLSGFGCLALLHVMRGRVAAWLGNTELANHLGLVGLLLALTLAAAAFEIVLISRRHHVKAAVIYASSDIARSLLFVIPALRFGGVRAILAGAAVFGGVRLLAMLVFLWREFGAGLRIDFGVWRRQLAYALPFALAVGIEVVQINFHQYFVAARFDAVTFAIYAVGCLQIPLVDLVMTSTVNVMMVQMAEHARAGDRRAAVSLWHSSVCKLAFLLVPLAVFLLVAARQVIVTLFTVRYLASVPIFTIWTLTILPSAFAVDGALRVYAQTRFLLLMNLLRFGLVVGLIGWFLSAFGLTGAVLITLTATSLVKALGVVRMARVLEASLAEILPWRELAGITLRAIAAAVPAFWITRMLALPPVAVLACAGAAFAGTYLALSYTSRALPWSFSRSSLETPAAMRPYANGQAPAAMPSRGQANPRRGISERSRWGWGPSASAKKLAGS
jgi:O-antigen/teichoic acid export membrane protein